MPEAGRQDSLPAIAYRKREGHRHSNLGREGRFTRTNHTENAQHRQTAFTTSAEDVTCTRVDSD